MRGERENFFSREKKFSLSPRAPLSLSRKAGKLFYLPLPTHVGNRALFFALLLLFHSQSFDFKSGEFELDFIAFVGDVGNVVPFEHIALFD